MKDNLRKIFVKIVSPILRFLSQSNTRILQKRKYARRTTYRCSEAIIEKFANLSRNWARKPKALRIRIIVQKKTKPKTREKKTNAKYTNYDTHLQT